MHETEFITLVSRMREAQKEYARNHRHDIQLKKQELEKQVDEEIARIKAFTNPPAYQPSLFDNINQHK